eukprot:3990825-Pyramimonas_sp.AAC.1
MFPDPSHWRSSANRDIRVGMRWCGGGGDPVSHDCGAPGSDSPGTLLSTAADGTRVWSGVPSYRRTFNEKSNAVKTESKNTHK